MIVYILPIFLIWKLIDVITSLVAPTIIPYLGNFSYADTMSIYGLPDFIRSWSNFDGIFYIRIAMTNYSQYEQAFFPLYPLLIRFFTPLFANNPIFTGLIITNTAFLLALIVLHKYLKLLDYSQSYVKWFIAFLVAYPLSFYFGVMYTESIFLLLLLSCLYFLHKRNFIMVFIGGYLAGLTRINGIFLLIPIAFYLIERVRKIEVDKLKAITSHIAVMFGPILGLATYCYYLWKTTGDPFYFFSAQEYFGAQRSTQLILFPQVVYRYIKIFMTADYNFQYFVAILEFVFFVAVFCILLIDLYRLVRNKQYNILRIGLNIFSFANLLLPTFTGTFTSIPRYSLLSISIFFLFSELKSRVLKISLLLLFVVLHIVLLAFFIQGYYIT